MGVKDASDLGAGTHQPYQTSRFTIKGAVTNHHSLWLPNQTSGIMQLLKATQGCQKCVVGMLGEFSGLTEVTIYPICATLL